MVEEQSTIPSIALDEQVTNVVDARPAVSEGICAVQTFSSGQFVTVCLFLKQSLVMFNSTPSVDDRHVTNSRLVTGALVVSLAPRFTVKLVTRKRVDIHSA